MATENVSKLLPFVVVGARSGQANVSKLVTYYIVNNNGAGTLIGGERLGSSFQPASNGDQLLITPILQASKGTPA